MGHRRLLQTNPFTYYPVAAVDHIGAHLKAAFKTATADDSDPLRQAYRSFSALREVALTIHTKYKKDFPEWLNESWGSMEEEGIEMARRVVFNLAINKLRAQKTEPRQTLNTLAAFINGFHGATSEYNFRKDMNLFGHEKRFALGKITAALPGIVCEIADIALEDLAPVRQKVLDEHLESHRARTAPRP